MADSPEESPGSPRRYGDVRAQRTKAFPSNTLFGSVLERLNSAEQRAVQEMDLESVGEQARVYDAPKIRGQPELALSAEQRDLVRREHEPELAAWRQEHHRLQRSLQCSEERLQQLQRHTRYNFDHPPADLLPPGERLRQAQEDREARRRWLSRQDLQHAPEVNRVGLKPVGAAVPRGYNRDKFGTRPPAHRYALIGDVLRPGMDFDAHVGRPQPPPLQEVGNVTRATRTKPKLEEREEVMRKLPPKTHVIPGSELEIPVNIKHHFGSRLCENIFADPTKLSYSARTPSTAAASSTAAKTAPASRRSSDGRPMNQNYAALSDMLRSNVFPGLTTGHHSSTVQRCHNETVYRRREPVPDEFRFQWDHVSRWNEANVIQSRVLKALEESKAAANAAK